MSVICGYRERGMWWFRLLGWGLSWEDHRIHRMLFSCRNNLGGHHVGPHCFRFLHRKDLR